MLNGRDKECKNCEWFLTYAGETEGICELTSIPKPETFTCKHWRESEG